MLGSVAVTGVVALTLSSRERRVSLNEQEVCSSGANFPVFVNFSISVMSLWLDVIRFLKFIYRSVIWKKK